MSTDKQSIDWYNQNAKAYADHVKNPKDSVYHAYYEKPAMYSLVPDVNGKKVISLGSGTGEDASYLKSLGAEEVIGVDISPEMVRIAQENHPECQFKVADMEHLDLPDSGFDFAYSSLAIHYIEDWTRVFKETYRILRPNSYFLFSCGHPVRYGMGKADTDTHWINKLEIAKNKESGEMTITGDYLNRTKLPNGFGKDTVTTWSKSFSEISSEIASSGFLIQQIVEPRPTEEMKDLFPEKYKKLNKVPEFVVFKLLKK